MACLLPSVIIFGVKFNDPNWMPYPTLNWVSWSYGLAVLTTFFSLFLTLAFESTWRESKRTLESAAQEFPLTAILRKSEKANILAQQKKLEIQARLEPVSGVTEEIRLLVGTSGSSEVTSQLYSPDNTKVRRRDPRFGAASGDFYY